MAKDHERLFETVFRDAERELVARIDAAAASATNPVDAVIAGCLAFVGVALDDDLRQIAVVDAPAVLGWSRWRAVDAELGLGSLQQGLEACKATGHVRDMDPSVLAHLISGAPNEAVFVVAEAADRRAAYARVSAATECLLRRWLDA